MKTRKRPQAKTVVGNNALAVALGVSVSTIRVWRALGLPARTPGRGLCNIYEVNSVRDWLASRGWTRPHRRTTGDGRNWRQELDRERAASLELTRREKAGHLIDRDIVNEEVATAFVNAKTIIEGVPTRVAAVLPQDRREHAYADAKAVVDATLHKLARGPEVDLTVKDDPPAPHTTKDEGDTEASARAEYDRQRALTAGVYRRAKQSRLAVADDVSQLLSRIRSWCEIIIAGIPAAVADELVPTCGTERRKTIEFEARAPCELAIRALRVGMDGAVAIARRAVTGAENRRRRA